MMPTRVHRDSAIRENSRAVTPAFCMKRGLISATTGIDRLNRRGAPVTLVAMVPGLLAMRRAAAALVVLTGQRNPRLMRRWLHAGLLVSCAIAIAIPWL